MQKNRHKIKENEMFLLVFEESVNQKHDKIWTHGCNCKVILKTVMPLSPFQLFLKILQQNGEQTILASMPTKPDRQKSFTNLVPHWSQSFFFLLKRQQMPNQRERKNLWFQFLGISLSCTCNVYSPVYDCTF